VSKSKKRKAKKKSSGIAKIALAFSLAVLLIWVMPILGALLRPNLLSSPGLVTHATTEITEFTKLADRLFPMGFDENSIHYLLSMKEQKKDAVVYPKLGIYAPMKIDGTDPTLVRNWDQVRNTLKQGVHGSYGKEDSNQSTLYVIGHSSDYDVLNPYASVFAALGQAEPGDSVGILQGEVLTIFQMIDTTTIKPNEVATFQSLGKSIVEGRDQIILVTCWPVLTTKSRMLVRAVATEEVSLK
jgi:LPXTG-site transpeptidase (sortase) family protein